MARQFARSDMVVAGQQYRRGDVVQMDKLPAAVARKLIDQRRVVADKVTVATGSSKGGEG